MSIYYHAETKQFHLYNKTFSYIIKILENGYIGQVYCGAPLDPQRGYPFLDPLPFYGFSNNDRNSIRFEYPAYGNGDYRLPAFTVRFLDGPAGGAQVVEPVYRAHRIIPGKGGIAGLPAIYTEDDREADTLELELEDAPSGLRIILYYAIFASHNCLVRHVRFINDGAEKVFIQNAMSFSLDLPDPDWNMVTLTGAWAREFKLTEGPLRPGFQGIESRRGISGHQQNPFLLLKRPGADDFGGEVLALSLIYSGNFLASAEVDSLGILRLRIGINNPAASGRGMLFS